MSSGVVNYKFVTSGIVDSNEIKEQKEKTISSYFKYYKNDNEDIDVNKLYQKEKSKVSEDEKLAIEIYNDCINYYNKNNGRGGQLDVSVLIKYLCHRIAILENKLSSTKVSTEIVSSPNAVNVKSTCENCNHYVIETGMCKSFDTKKEKTDSCLCISLK